MTKIGEINRRIEALPNDFLFGRLDLGLPASWGESVSKQLNSLVEQGRLKKYQKGRFYKPLNTIIGTLEISQGERIKDLLYDGDKVIGYYSGCNAFNILGLTTQVPSQTLTIGVNGRKKPMSRPPFKKIYFVNQPNKITQDVVTLLQVLDSIRFIKEIPGTTIESSIIRLIEIVVSLTYDEVERLIVLGMRYQPRVRALLGAILEQADFQALALELLATLNPATTYDLGLQKGVINNKKWRLK